MPRSLRKVDANKLHLICEEFIELLYRDAIYFGLDQTHLSREDSLTRVQVYGEGKATIWLSNATLFSWTGETLRIRLETDWSDEDGWYTITTYNETEPRVDDAGDELPFILGIFDETLGWMALHLAEEFKKVVTL